MENIPFKTLENLFKSYQANISLLQIIVEIQGKIAINITKYSIHHIPSNIDSSRPLS